MIKKIVKLLTNPQGALVQLILDQVAKVFKLDKVLRYVEQDNELDVAVENMIKKQTEIDLKIKAMQSIIKDFDKKNDVAQIRKDFEKFKKTKFI
tara:strand:+ start:459 stop:740 length:282 start_codon:yes stop_codon:yes gene_type:complete